MDVGRRVRQRRAAASGVGAGLQGAMSVRSYRGCLRWVMPVRARLRCTGGVKESITASDDAVQASVLAGAFHAAMFLIAAGAFLVLGLPRAAGAAAVLGMLLWATALLHWALASTIARFAQRRQLRRVALRRGEIAAPR
jgi:uncharacterized membrane protein YphA (DoxX/SURF4 family)